MPNEQEIYPTNNLLKLTDIPMLGKIEDKSLIFAAIFAPILLDTAEPNSLVKKAVITLLILSSAWLIKARTPRKIIPSETDIDFALIQVENFSAILNGIETIIMRQQNHKTQYMSSVLADTQANLDNLRANCVVMSPEEINKELTRIEAQINLLMKKSSNARNSPIVTVVDE